MPQGKGTYGTKVGRPPKKTEKGKDWTVGDGYSRDKYVKLPGVDYGSGSTEKTKTK